MYYCKKCQASSWNEPFRNDLCDQCWELKNGHYVQYRVSWEKETEGGTPYHEYQEVNVPEVVIENADNTTDIADWLSDKYGWLVESLEPVK
jgi:hypothetical protein